MLVLDRRSIGEGSTAASTALLQYEVDTPMHLLARRIGEDRAVRVHRLGLEAIASIGKLAATLRFDCAFARRPSLQLASAPSHLGRLEREHDLRRRHGFGTTVLSGAALRRRYGVRRPGALLTSDAAEIDPYRLTHALLQRSMRRGASVHDRTSVVRHVPRRAGVELRTDRGFSIRAGTVVYATGYETMDFLPRRLTTIRTTYALASDPVAIPRAWHERCLIWETGRPYLYLRTTSDDRIIVGGGDDDDNDPVARARRLPRKVRWLVQQAQTLFPSLRLDVAFCWAGAFAETKDTLPYIGAAPGFRHSLFALGYGGNGITFSAIAADIIAGVLRDGGHPDAALFAFDRTVGSSAREANR